MNKLPCPACGEPTFTRLGSVINIPVADDAGEVRLTVNLLAGPGRCTAERVEMYEGLVAAARGGLIGAV